MSTLLLTVRAGAGLPRYYGFGDLGAARQEGHHLEKEVAPAAERMCWHI